MHYRVEVALAQKRQQNEFSSSGSEQAMSDVNDSEQSVRQSSESKQFRTQMMYALMNKDICQEEKKRRIRLQEPNKDKVKT